MADVHEVLNGFQARRNENAPQALDVVGDGETLFHLLEESRLAALLEIDQAPFSWFHVKVCVVAGIGFFTDAYDIFAINIASTMIGLVYGSKHKLTANQDLGIKVATPIGTLFGQLFFGMLADVYGRKRMYGIELVIMIVATFGQALAGHGHALNIIGTLALWRFIMGIGIGGDYPLSAIIASEFAPIRIRGRMMTTVFANQGWGNLAAALTALVIVTAYRRHIEGDSSGALDHVDYCWRLLIGLGCVPAVIALYFRLTIPETPRFTLDIARNLRKAARDVAFLTHGTVQINPDIVLENFSIPQPGLRDFRHYFSNSRNFLILFAAAYSWFALDVAFYGLGLNSSIILQAIGFGGDTTSIGESITGPDAYRSLRHICVGNLILSIAGLIPGYWVAFLFIDKWGRKRIQLMGFIVLTILFVIMGFAYDKLIATATSKRLFVFLYCLANFFQNFGPNTTTFLIPGELFPTRYRSTCHGIAAASGKLGAIISQVVFTRLADIGGPNKFIKHIIKIFALFMLTGVFSTLLLPETNGLPLESLCNETKEQFPMGALGHAGLPNDAEQPEDVEA